jgi:cysteine desulfurase/selenocysteine lyase
MRSIATTNANVSRAVHTLGSEATESYEAARTRLARHLNVAGEDLVLTSGTTFAINLVAYSWGLPRLKSGDVILLTRMEHHANIVPWQLICERTGATIRVADLHPDGSLDLDALYAAMTPEVKLLGVAHVSNVLGTINPVAAICKEARKRGITTVVDGSQALPHMAVDIAAIGCDFYAFTGHKMCGPTGTGALWARRELAGVDAPLPRRRRDDQGSALRRHGLRRSAASFRSGHAEHRGPHRPGRGGHVSRRHRHGRDRRARSRAVWRTSPKR